MKTRNICLAIALSAVSMSYSQNSLLQGATTSSLPAGGIIKDIEIVSNGTDVVLLAASESNSEFYAIDIADNDATDAVTNVVTQINNFQALVEGATGQSNLAIQTFEVNPISHSIYVLARNFSWTESYIVKIEDDGATVSVLDQSNMTFSLIDWNGTNTYSSEDMTWGSNTLYITSGSAFTLDGEIATVAAPFIHNSTTTNRATTMFKTNWGGGYYTTAPLERIVFGTINGEDRLMGVTVCAPGFSIKTSDVVGTGLLQVEQQFDVFYSPPIKMVHQHQDGTDYLFDLHNDGPTLVRIGEEFIDGSPIANNQTNAANVQLRDINGNASVGLTEEQVKVYPQSFEQIAFWDNCNLLVIENGTMKLFQTGTAASCANNVGIETIDNLNTVEVIPNPATDYIKINLESNELSSYNAEIIIHSIGGEEVIRQNLTNESTTLDISSLPKGIYSVVVMNNGKRKYLEKLIIQ